MIRQRGVRRDISFVFFLNYLFMLAERGIKVRRISAGRCFLDKISKLYVYIHNGGSSSKKPYFTVDQKGVHLAHHTD